MKRVLIFNPFGIGDVLFTTPLVRNLKENIKDVSIHYLCNARVYPLLRHNKFLDEVFVFEKDQWRVRLKESKWLFLKDLFRFQRRIRKGRFDVLFDYSLNSQYGFFFKTTGIKKRLGFNYRNRGRFLTHKIDIPHGYRDKHVARYYLDLLKFLDIKARDCNFDLFMPREAIDEASRLAAEYGFGKDRPLAAVCPGSGDSWRDSAYFKRWGEDKFIDLCRDLNEKLSARVVLFGSEQESSICTRIERVLGPMVVNLCAKLSLDKFCAVMNLCDLVITNDGGPFHIAQGLKKKAVVFFGPVDERVYGPYPDSSNCRVFTANVSCRPCYKSFRFTGCQNDKKCLREIKKPEVFEVIKGWV